MFRPQRAARTPQIGGLTVRGMGVFGSARFPAN
jgi:hypothetical protein